MFDVLDRGVSLSSIKVPLGGVADQVAFGVEIDVTLIAADGLEQIAGDFLEETGVDGLLGLSSTKAAAGAGPGEVEFRFGARHADVAETALLFHGGFGIERAAVGEQTFFESGDEDDGEFESLGVVHGEEGDGG